MNLTTIISMQAYSSRLRRECELSGLMKFGEGWGNDCVLHESEDRMGVWKKSNVHFMVYPFERQLNGAHLHVVSEQGDSHHRPHQIACFAWEYLLNITS